MACRSPHVNSLASDFGNLWSQNLVQIEVFHCASAMQEKSCLPARSLLFFRDDTSAPTGGGMLLVGKKK